MTADSISSPKLKPRTSSQSRIVPAIRSREVARTDGPGIGRGENPLQPLDLGDDLLVIHSH
jgi:hypothetical protein